MQSNQSNCNSIILLRSDFASLLVTLPSWKTASSTDAVVQLVVSIDFKVYVCSDKHLSMLHDWHLLNVQQAKYLFSAILEGTNRDCDVINTLCPKTMTNRKFFSFFLCFDNEINTTYTCNQTCLSELWSTGIPANPKQIAKNRFPPTHFTSLIWKPRCPTPARNLETDMSYQWIKNAKPDYANCYLVAY